MRKSTKFDVDIEILKKYNRPGPRYTSYPTAPHFHSGYGPQEFKETIVRSNEGKNLSDLSLYFHLPFCRSLCFYCGCNVVITHNPTRIEEYIDYLKREIDMISRLVNPRRKVVQHHWGGGTPTYLSPEQIADLFKYIKDHFDFSKDAEVSIEVDPRRLDPDHLPTIRKVGFNRISFGVQDFDPQVQEAVNRVQPEELTRQVMEASRDLGFHSINVDLIYGLPYQTVESYSKTIDKIIELNPDRLAVFNYAHVPWLKKHQRVIPREALPQVTERLAILKMVIERLTEAGYVFIGMDHFAKPDDELSIALKEHTLYRNFQGYTTRAGTEVYAMGITAISQLHDAYAQNVKNTRDYYEMIDKDLLPTHVGYALTEDDKLRRHVITEIMCNSRIIKKDIEAQYGIKFDEYFADAYPKLQEFVDDNLLELHEDRIIVREAGRLVIRNIAMAFDKYLEQDQKAQKPIYSQTV